MKKYKEPLSQKDKELLDKLSKKDFSNFNETEVREEFITPLLALLGYEKNTDYEVEREESFKLKNMYLQIGSNKKLKLDYICNIRKNNFWLIETKSGEKKEIVETDIQQAYFYSLHPKVNCRYFVVSNGWITNLYDRNQFLTKDDADVFQPILSIAHSEIKEKFDALYYRLGSSNIIFNVKEDCLLQEIKKTMSSEIYINRLEQFEWKVQRALRESESKVYENIRALNKRENPRKKQNDNFRNYLESLKEIDIIRTFFNGPLSRGNFDIIYSVFKEKLLKHYEAVGSSKSSSLSCVLDYLLSPSPTFVYSQRIIKSHYPINVVVFLLMMIRDNEFKDFRIWYNKTECSLREALESYLLDLFSFFEKNLFLRYSMIIYPLCYKIAKFYVFGFGILDNQVRQMMNYREYFLSEEDLSQTYHSVGIESINRAEEFTDKLLQDLIKDGFNGDVIKFELFKKTVRDLEGHISLLNQKIDLNKLKREIPSSHQDEMFPIDNHADNPWQILFLYVIRILGEDKYLIQNNETKNKIEELAKNGFISKPLFIQAFYDYPDFERSFHDKNEEALKKYSQYNHIDEKISKEKMIEILAKLKFES